jgi:hypothetical protein
MNSFALLPAVWVAVDLEALSDSPDSSKRHRPPVRTVLEVTRHFRPWTVASAMLLRSPQGLADSFGCSRVEIVTFPDGTYFQSGAWYLSPSLLGIYR